MTEHKHAEFLRALADGVPLEAFIATRDTWLAEDSPKAHNISDIYMLPERWQVRRKPKTIRIGEFSIDEVESLANCVLEACKALRSGDNYDLHCLKAGLVHPAHASAICHGQALRSFT